MNNSERFLTAHNKLEKLMQKELNKTGDYYQLVDEYCDRLIITEEDKYFLKSCARLRNAIVHEYHNKKEPIAEPRIDVTERLEKVYEKITNPPSALSIATNFSDLKTAKLEDNTKGIIDEMHRNGYTHVPVTNEDGSLFGVFSENTLISMIVDQEFDKDDTAIIELGTLKDLEKHLPIEEHDGEYFRFISRKESVYEVKKIFSEYDFKNDLILAGIFITNSGSEKEKILGFITAWDVVNKID